MTRTEVLLALANYAKENPEHTVFCVIADDNTNGQIVNGNPPKIVNMLFNVFQNAPELGEAILSNAGTLAKIIANTYEHSSEG